MLNADHLYLACKVWDLMKVCVESGIFAGDIGEVLLATDDMLEVRRDADGLVIIALDATALDS